MSIDIRAIGLGGSYASTPDKNVDANVKALSACVNSPYRGGPAGCASILSFDTRNPAPRSVFFSLIGVFLATVFFGTAGDFVAGAISTIVQRANTMFRRTWHFYLSHSTSVQVRFRDQDGAPQTVNIPVVMPGMTSRVALASHFCATPSQDIEEPVSHR
jgi:hypothetical protein